MATARPTGFSATLHHPEATVAGDVAAFPFASRPDQRGVALADGPVPPAAALAGRPFYFEVAVLAAGEQGVVTVGVCPADYDVRVQLGWLAGSCAYHGDDGRAFWQTGTGRPYAACFAEGAVVGCLVDPLDGSVAFTLNGDFLGVAVRGAAVDGVHPAVGTSGSGARVQINFGDRPFAFDLAAYCETALPPEEEVAERLAAELLLATPRAVFPSRFVAADEQATVRGDRVYFAAGEPDAPPAAVLTDHPLPMTCGWFYFEVTIARCRLTPRIITIGLCPRGQPGPAQPLGWAAGTIGLHEDGRLFAERPSDIEHYGPALREGDTVGCLVHATHRVVGFTVNGRSLGCVPVAAPLEALYPAAVCRQPGLVLRYNGGARPFAFAARAYFAAVVHAAPTALPALLRGRSDPAWYLAHVPPRATPAEQLPAIMRAAQAALTGPQLRPLLGPKQHDFVDFALRHFAGFAAVLDGPEFRHPLAARATAAHVQRCLTSLRDGLAMQEADSPTEQFATACAARLRQALHREVVKELKKHEKEGFYRRASYLKHVGTAALADVQELFQRYALHVAADGRPVCLQLPKVPAIQLGIWTNQEVHQQLADYFVGESPLCKPGWEAYLNQHAPPFSTLSAFIAQAEDIGRAAPVPDAEFQQQLDVVTMEASGRLSVTLTSESAFSRILATKRDEQDNVQHAATVRRLVEAEAAGREAVFAAAQGAFTAATASAGLVAIDAEERGARQRLLAERDAAAQALCLGFAPRGAALPAVEPDAMQLVPLDADAEETWQVEQLFKPNNSLAPFNEEQVAQGRRPLTFRVTAVWKVVNPELAARFEQRAAWMRATAAFFDRQIRDLRERVTYHGCHPANVGRICTNGLLRIGHPLNPSTSTDDGYFGDPRCGVYVSQYPDYTLKYANRLKYPELGERVRIIMLRTLPGRSYQFSTLRKGVQPREGHDSHLSSQGQEWYLFDETQCCPVYVLEVEVIVNTRKCGDDV